MQPMSKSNILIRSKLKKAQALAEQGKLDEAKKAYTQIYNANKSNDSIGLELAVIHRKLGEFSETEKISKNIVVKSPDNAQAHHIYGSALQCLGDIDNAIAEYIIAIKLDPKLTQGYYFLGNAYQLTGQQELAAESFKKAIELEPNFYEALNNLGAILITLHRLVEAKDFLERAFKINPNSNQLLCNIAEYYLLENNLEKTETYATQAYKSDPYFVDALKLLGQVNYRKPDYNTSLEFFRKAYEISKDEEITGSIAQILERRGEYEEANKLIHPLIESGKTNVAILLTYSALGRKYGHQKEAIEAIENKIKTSTLDKISQINLHSELGKQYDSLEMYDKAFENYNKANLIERDLNKQIENLNLTRDLNNTNKADIDTWFSDYPKEFWNNLPSSNNNSKRPIFVIGMFRSGTTLCEQILSSHSDVTGAGELKNINSISHAICNSKLHDKSPASLVNATQQHFIDGANSYLKTLDTHSTESKNIVDKMPANFFHVGLISRLFPNAHIIHMIREPRDVCLSMFFQRFGPQMTFSTDLEELADYHLAYQRVMQYWQEVLDIKILNVVYEDLVDNQEEMTRKMLEFCGLEWNEKCMNFHQSKRDVNTPSYDQVRKPLYKKSVARWKNYAEFVKPLLNKLDAK